MEIIQLPLFTGKVCSKCQIWKPYADYRKRLEMADGHRGVCRLCQRKEDNTRTSQYSEVATTKRCPCCAEVRDAKYFNRSKRNKDGLSSYCKECKEKHRPVPVQLQAIGKKCPVCRVKKPAKDFGSCQANTDGLQSKCKKCKRAQNAKNPIPAVKCCPMCKQTLPAAAFYRNRAMSNGLACYCKTCKPRGNKGTPAKRRADYNRYIARKKSVGGTYTAKQWKVICDYYDNKCLRCGKQGKLTVDHVVSLLHGGSNNVDNLQPLCKSCNSSKSSNDTDYRPDGGAFSRSLL